MFVTNGGYGGVHYALGHGVPIVVAGMTEDKAEVSARVVWSGTGISLRTNTPSDAQVAEAVDRVLAEPSYRDAARRLGAEIAAAPGVAGILPIIDGTPVRCEPAELERAPLPEHPGPDPHDRGQGACRDVEPVAVEGASVRGRPTRPSGAASR